MKKINKSVIIILCVLFLSNFVSISVYGQDFDGDVPFKVNLNINGQLTVPSDWNTTSSSPNAGYKIENLFTSNGIITPIGMELLSTWTDARMSGATGGIFPDNVSQTYFNIGTDDIMQIKFYGLPQSLRYNFKFFPSRASSGDRNTEFTINEQTVIVNAANNLDQTADFFEIKADSNNEIIVSIKKSPTAFFGYLNAIQISAFEDIIPRKPQNLTAIAISNSQIDLSWESGYEDIISYSIERSISDNSGFTEVATVNGDINSFNDGGLNSGLKYYYRIRATNPTGISAYSDEVWSLAVQEPTIQTTNLNISQISTTSLNLSFDAGNGQNRIVVIKAGSVVNRDPVDGVDYVANSSYPLAGYMAEGCRVLYKGLDETVIIDKLTPDQTYHFAVYEYNEIAPGNNNTANYLTIDPTIGSFTPTSPTAEPTINSSNIIITQVTTTSLNLSWDQGDGQNRLVIARESFPVSGDPIDGFNYNNANSNFINAQYIFNAGRVVYNGSGETVTVEGLFPDKTYHFAVYEYNELLPGNNGSSNYLILNPLTGSATPQSAGSEPTSQASNLVITQVGPNSLNLTWDNSGDGQSRVVLIRQAYPVAAIPIDGKNYNRANSFFPNAQYLARGSRVVYNGSGNSVTVSGLAIDKTFHFAVFEYNEILPGNNGTSDYLTENPLIGSGVPFSGFRIADNSIGSLSDLKTVEHEKWQSEIKVYPNPTDGMIFVDNLSEDLNIEIQVFNTSGKLIYHLPVLQSPEINLDMLKRGLYIIKISSGSSSTIKKLIVE